MDDAMMFTRVWFAGMFERREELPQAEEQVMAEVEMEAMSMGELLYFALTEE